MSDDVRHRYKDWQTALATTVYPEGFTGIALEPTAWDAVRLIERLRTELASLKPLTDAAINYDLLGSCQAGMQPLLMAASDYAEMRERLEEGEQ